MLIHILLMRVYHNKIHPNPECFMILSKYDQDLNESCIYGR
ncbi:hypothetical protein IFVP22_C210092 [Vibrio parahaemolyticus]